jgi:hypothetical protein
MADQVRVTVAAGRVTHMGGHAFQEGDTLTLPAEHAAELIGLGQVTPEAAPEPAPAP